MSLGSLYYRGGVSIGGGGAPCWYCTVYPIICIDRTEEPTEETKLLCSALDV